MADQTTRTIVHYAEYLEDTHKRIVEAIEPIAFDIANEMNPFATFAPWDIDQLYIDPSMKGQTFEQWLVEQDLLGTFGEVSYTQVEVEPGEYESQPVYTEHQMTFWDRWNRERMPTLFGVWRNNVLNLDVVELWAEMVARASYAAPPMPVLPSMPSMPDVPDVSASTVPVPTMPTMPSEPDWQTWVENAVSARRAFLLHEFDTQIDPRIRAGMRDSNSITSSYYAVAREAALANHLLQLNEFQAQLELKKPEYELQRYGLGFKKPELELQHASLAMQRDDVATRRYELALRIPALHLQHDELALRYGQLLLSQYELSLKSVMHGTDVWRSMLQWHVSIPQEYGKALATYGAQRADIEGHVYELSSKACLWPFTALGQLASVLAALTTGSTTSTVAGEAGGTSKNRLAGLAGGALSGAAAGSVGGPWGILIGGVVGAVGGAFA